MPDVNLLKDTERLDGGAKKPLPPTSPELTEPAVTAGRGIGGVFKSMFSHNPHTLPTATPAASSMGAMSVKKAGGSGERILSEKRSAPSVIPLPEEEETSYNVNLLSDDLGSTVDPKRRLIALGAAAIGAVLVLGLAYGGLLYYKQSIDKDISATQAQLADVKAQVLTENTQQTQAAAATQKLAAIRSLIDRHTRWTKFFSLIERYTLPTVTYGPAFSGDLNGSVGLAATTNSYEELAQQYLIFKQLVDSKKFISSFSITGATASTSKETGTKVNFVIAMTLLPSDFTMTAQEAQDSLSTALGTTVAPPSSTSVTAPTTPTTP